MCLFVGKVLRNRLHYFFNPFNPPVIPTLLLLIIITMSNPPIIPTPPIIRDSGVFKLRPYEGDHFCPPKVNIQYFINSKGQYWILHKFQRSILNTSQISRVNIQYFSNSKGQYSILHKLKESIFNTSQIPRVNIEYF